MSVLHWNLKKQNRLEVVRASDSLVWGIDGMHFTCRAFCAMSCSLKHGGLLILRKMQKAAHLLFHRSIVSAPVDISFLPQPQIVVKDGRHEGTGIVTGRRLRVEHVMHCPKIILLPARVFHRISANGRRSTHIHAHKRTYLICRCGSVFNIEKALPCTSSQVKPVPTST